jgi:MYXO-CTERM domain-containing protein
MKSKFALASVLAVTLVAPAAIPCGAPFGTGINVDPKQDIIVVHKAGTETYVFQPRFCGSAKEFGLVLPVPSKLSAQPSLTNSIAFTTLVTLSQPTYRYATVCNSRGAGGSTGTGSNGSDAGASVISSGTVGLMDFAQLDTVSVDALTAWLTQNGYPYDAQATAAFDYYVQKGWYFLTFRISQGVDAGGASCRDLGPVKFSFPTAVPVVPTRMATARSKDTSGALASASSFSWRIFGITDGSEQLSFSGTGPTSRVLNFSGLIGSSDVTTMAGLAVAGDRATKMTVSFNYGASDPDIGLGLAAGVDYREVITQTTYIQCYDGGTDTAIVRPPDAPIDLGPPPVDVAPDSRWYGDTLALDTARLITPDVATPRDASPPPSAPDGAVAPPPPEAKSDAGPVVVADAAPGKPDAGPFMVADASPPKTDTAPVMVASDAGTTPKDPTPEPHSSGCSFTAAPGASGIIPLLIIGMAIALRRRRR